MRNLFTCIILLSCSILPGQTLRELYQEGVEAYEAKDYGLLLKKMERIDSLRPNYAPISYNQAAAHALLGNPRKAIRFLDRYLQMDTTQSFEKDPDFDSIRSIPEYPQLLDRKKELTEEVSVDVILELRLMASHPESITYSRKQKSYFIGGVRDGRIWKVKKGIPEVWAESASNGWAMMGLALDTEEKYLWSCTSAMDQYEELTDEDLGKVSVQQYNLKSGKLLETFALPANHTFGDLVVDKTGNVFTSDGTANHIYWIEKDQRKLELFKDLSDQAFNLQGLSFNEDQTAIFISDYINGIYKLDLRTKEVIKLGQPKNLIIKGIDGLYYQDGTLIGLQNGTRPNRVTKYLLNEDETAIIESRIVAQSGPLGEPTQGVFVKDKFHFIVNSPWVSYDQEGNFSPGDAPIIIGAFD